MQIIPVLDLMGGLVVRGVMGDRANYRPLESRLSASPDPAAVAKGLRRLGAFRAFYLADLDAIGGRPPNEAAVAALRAALGDTELWLDAGVRSRAGAQSLLGLPRTTAVLGSETIDGAATLAALRDDPRIVLSLDYRGERFLGPAALEADAALWPSRVVAMTLARVGSGAGPDWERLARLLAQAGDRRVFAAGGVRHAADLVRLEAMGVAGVLLASALHDGRLTPETLRRFAA